MSKTYLARHRETLGNLGEDEGAVLDGDHGV
jgi:hypothetical protein